MLPRVFEEVCDSRLVAALHRECLPRAGLSIGEACDDAPSREGQRHVRSQRRLIQSHGRLAPEDVIKLKIVILDVFRDSIHLELALVHAHRRIHSTHSINLSPGLLLREDGSLSNAHRYLHPVGGLMRSLRVLTQSRALNKHVKFGIDVSPGLFVSELSV